MAAWRCKEFMWQKKLVKSEHENTRASQNGEQNMMVDRFHFEDWTPQYLHERRSMNLFVIFKMKIIVDFLCCFFLSLSKMQMLPLLRCPAVNFFTRLTIFDKNFRKVCSTDFIIESPWADWPWVSSLTKVAIWHHNFRK